MRVAVVHEWLVNYAGSERVVEQILSLYPDAALYSLVNFLDNSSTDFIHHRPVHTSFIQNLPFATRSFRSYLPLMPLAIEQLDVSGYDVVISSSHAVAKGVITRADQLHISYVHTPIRYAWDLQHQYLQGAGLKSGIKGAIARLILHYLRLWDLASANRVDHFVANSHYVARRIWKTYRRRSTVIYPPVAVQRFDPHCQRENFYFVLARFVPYKQVELIVAAFVRLGLPLVVMGDGPDGRKLRRLAAPNIQFLTPQSETVVASYMARCKAFVYAAEEDFGIAAVEAQAAGAPVIAFGKGGVTETVIPGKTGLFFLEQSVESLIESIKEFESGIHHFSPDYARQNAERFAPERFRQDFSQFVEQKWTHFRLGDDIQ
ncbi:MAG TPA: glycosyltransferase [Elainellaceae cyanobacterium]